MKRERWQRKKDRVEENREVEGEAEEEEASEISKLEYSTVQYSTVQTSVGSTHEQLTRLTPLPPVINNNSTVKNTFFLDLWCFTRVILACISLLHQLYGVCECARHHVHG